jgi:hypothetical protein
VLRVAGHIPAGVEAVEEPELPSWLRATEPEHPETVRCPVCGAWDFTPRRRPAARPRAETRHNLSGAPLVP